MRFRPCIDIHNGKVKQIVGGSLKDEKDQAEENFISEQSAAFYARLYREKGLKGGHVILLNQKDSEYFEATQKQALEALREYPKGLQIGGGICRENGEYYLEAGASHVIVTSYVFKGGRIFYENLEKMKAAVGREHLVLDMSCRKKEGKYYVATDRWQNFTEEEVTLQLLCQLESYCDEFLIHAVDVEGKAKGIEKELVRILAGYQGNSVTYAGGVGSMNDIQILQEEGKGKVDVTVGSALDLFGGTIPWEKLVDLRV